MAGVRSSSATDFAPPLGMSDEQGVWPISKRQWEAVTATVTSDAHKAEVLSVLERNPSNAFFAAQQRKSWRPGLVFERWAVEKLGHVVQETDSCASLVHALGSRDSDPDMCNGCGRHPGVCETEDAHMMQSCEAFHSWVVNLNKTLSGDDRHFVPILFSSKDDPDGLHTVVLQIGSNLVSGEEHWFSWLWRCHTELQLPQDQ